MVVRCTSNELGFNRAMFVTIRLPICQDWHCYWDFGLWSNNVCQGDGSSANNSMEEVEESLKTHPKVVDALVFGLADDRFGQSIAAVVSLEPGTRIAPEELTAHVRSRLSHYKAPRRLHIVATVPRAPNGKPDYPSAKEMFAAAQA